MCIYRLSRLLKYLFQYYISYDIVCIFTYTYLNNNNNCVMIFVYLVLPKLPVAFYIPLVIHKNFEKKIKDF